MFLSVVNQVDRGALGAIFAFILDDVGAVAEAVTYREAIPVGRHMRCERELVAFLVKSEDVLNTRLVRP